jgi:hypothetical protein
MRELIIKKRAENAIYKVAQFVASKNFPSSGGKFINEVFDFCIDYSLLNLKHPLCKNSVLAKHGYSCTVYKKKWVVVFKCTDKQFIVYRFVYGAMLK